jgi:hypothetical protein
MDVARDGRGDRRRDDDDDDDDKANGDDYDQEEEGRRWTIRVSTGHDGDMAHNPRAVGIYSERGEGGGGWI